MGIKIMKIEIYNVRNGYIIELKKNINTGMEQYVANTREILVKLIDDLIVGIEMEKQVYELEEDVRKVTGL